MAEVVQMFLFLFKSKYRRKYLSHYDNISKYIITYPLLWAVIVLLILFGVITTTTAASSSSSSSSSSTTSGLEIISCTLDNCINGDCVNGSCICHDGWQGSACQHCSGKVKLTAPSGSIHDGVGNYTTDVKCSWLIESSPNSSIRMHIEEFATECGWDHLYIYDGDSVEAPLLGIFTGLMHKDGYHIRRVPEIIAKSGTVFLHFYSDVAYNMSGFNISYKVNACPSRYSHTDCSGHGACIDGTCTCDGMWTGEACDSPVCPNNCTHQHEQGECNPERHQCDCLPGFKGPDCSQKIERGYWETITYDDYLPDGSASHCSIVWRDSLYIVGGESFHKSKMIYVYDFNGNVWETPHIEGTYPLSRYAHSCVLFGDKIFMYGGVKDNTTFTNEIWAFDISAKIWENVTVKSNCNNNNNIAANKTMSMTMCGPLNVAGHTATLIHDSHDKNEKMVVIFGHSPQYGYLNTVQEYYFGTREWKIIDTIGFPVKGGYGHSSAHDKLTNLIYVYGGYVSESQSTQALTNRIYSYNPNSHVWRLLTSAPSARFFHTGIFVSDGLMLIFGGNTHNDTIHSHGARCYSADTIAYDVTCDSWHYYSMPREMSDLPRYGHSANVFQKSIYIYGGFDGQILSDMIKYTPGNCQHLLTQSQCLISRTGTKCIWDKRQDRCVEYNKKIIHIDNYDTTYTYIRCPDDNQQPRGMTSPEELCKLFKDCSACVQNSYDCSWCGKNCAYEICRRGGGSGDEPPIVGITTLEQCDLYSGIECYQLHTCHACTSNPHCMWAWPNGNDRCKPLMKIKDTFILNNNNNNYNHHHHSSSNSNNNNMKNYNMKNYNNNNNYSLNNNNNNNNGIQAQPLTMESCKTYTPCVDWTSCRNCTEFDCIWCQNENKCVDKNAYPVSFPYGQCREWTTSESSCRDTNNGKEWCNFYDSCLDCRSDPGCGWCDDGSKTGKGKCMSGGSKGPNTNLKNNYCKINQWFFTSCPVCQCNGHSTCIGDSNECIKPCGNLTRGIHCDKCMPGYYGSPLNGATCQPCSCNDQGTECTSETGKCYCTTKGIIGDHCERCDISSLYEGDPTRGSCFYQLAIDYQFTFNLSKKEDRHYRAINFKNSPSKPDVDAEFSIACSVLAKMNITMRKANRPEQPLLLGANCTTYKYRFSKADYNFATGESNTTFYVYVYDFQPPLWIQISFSQYSKLNLQQFFITFSTCFLALLMVAAILWKIKQKYDMYRRRQRLFVEMQQMASRAFSQVLVEINIRDVSNEVLKNEQELNGNTRHKKKKDFQDAPSPIALEPCCGNRAAVLSLLVRLPTGDELYTPAGQSAGLAVASALVTLGSPRRPSQELTAKEPKKTRKSASQHPDSTCI
ncbi:attractin-like protein 1 isoform X2 [Aphidius gifuensis]|uniref:attractin-like protein 1 isoform X2 n=1 Tax=Aphidius gifuensis TaxID=684658 RepID=UPI001CDCBEC1|nr:attractin-like protein 1 isoform X2 [Aphidius gifuensis]